MKFGLKPEEFSFVKKNLFDPVTTQGGKVWIFGSRARGDHHPFSDLDVLVEHSSFPKGSLESIREALEKSDLPFKVDIVLLGELADSYRDQALKERQGI